jgi:hypothetical protein
MITLAAALKDPDAFHGVVLMVRASTNHTVTSLRFSSANGLIIIAVIYLGTPHLHRSGNGVTNAPPTG